MMGSIKKKVKPEMPDGKGDRCAEHQQSEEDDADKGHDSHLLMKLGKR